MKERPIFPLLVSMALPMVLSMTVNALYNIVDSFFVAQISEQAMTALSLVYPVQNMINAIAIGFGVGINALIALYSGAGDRCRADTAATHGLVFSILHGLIGDHSCKHISRSGLCHCRITGGIDHKPSLWRFHKCPAVFQYTDSMDFFCIFP